MANSATPAPDAQPPTPETCPECAPRYCALGRCYCGHAECPAIASYVDVRSIPFRDTATKRGGTSSWDNREGATWIDQL